MPDNNELGDKMRIEAEAEDKLRDLLSHPDTAAHFEKAMGRVYFDASGKPKVAGNPDDGKDTAEVLYKIYGTGIGQLLSQNDRLKGVIDFYNDTRDEMRKEELSRSSTAIVRGEGSEISDREAEIARFKITAIGNILPTDERVRAYAESLEEEGYKGQSAVETEVIDDEDEIRDNGEHSDDGDEGDAVDAEYREVDNEESGTEAQGKKGVWYEGIIKDLRDATNINVSPEDRLNAIRRLEENGVNLPEIKLDPVGMRVSDESQGNKNRFKIGSAVDFIEGGQNDLWGSKEEVLRYLKDELGIRVDALQNMTGQEESGSPTPQVPEPEEALENVPPASSIESDIKTIMDEIPLQYQVDELKRLLDRCDNFDQRKAVYIKINEIEKHDAPRAINLEDVTRRFENLSNPLNFGGDIKQRQASARRFLENFREVPGVTQEMIDEATRIADGVEAKFLVDREKGIDEEDQIREYCFKQIFVVDLKDQARSSQSIYNSMTSPNGFLRTGLFKSVSEADALARRTKEIIDELGLDNWIAVRDNVGAWANLVKPKAEDVTSYDITPSLFLPIYAETWFAGIYSEDRHFIRKREITLPGNETVDLQEAVSEAMARMRHYFEGSWKPDLGNPKQPGLIVPEDKRKSVEYWHYVNSDMASKTDLYTSLGINKYVGEVAFSLLLSHNMLTDTSSYDIFLQMVDTAKRRVAAYTVSEERDPLVRMREQEVLADGGETFTDVLRRARERNDKDMEERSVRLQKQMESWVATVLPRHMIATGLTRGRFALDNRGWLKWRVETDTYLTSQKGREKSQGALNPDTVATDPIARREMMSNALDVLTAMKEMSKPESELSSLEGLKGKVMKWTLGDLVNLGWTRDIGGKKLVHREFCLEDGRGNARDTDPAVLASRIMLIASQMFMYAHSIADAEDKKPWDLKVMSERAKAILGKEIQSGKGTYIGLSTYPEINKTERAIFIAYVDSLFTDCYSVVKSVRFPWSRVPKWFDTGIPMSDEFRVFLFGQLGLGNEWEIVKQKIKL